MHEVDELVIIEIQVVFDDVDDDETDDVIHDILLIIIDEVEVDDEVETLHEHIDDADINEYL